MRHACGTGGIGDGFEIHMCGKIGMAGTTFRPGNGVPGHCCGLWKYCTRKGVSPDLISKVMEVNSSPGLEGIEAATNKDVAGMVVKFIESHARPHRTQTKGAKG